MIDKCSRHASEIAYYSDLPRTKAYFTLKKLEKKKLFICSALASEEAFSGIVEIYERRSKNMKKIVETLKVNK
jgi:HTH-type transcriptional regulator, sugar sensing transcriptional regulator